MWWEKQLCKYTPVYVAEMRQLETEQSDAYKQLQSGAFVVRRPPKRQFNCVPTDQALEQTVNREAKSYGWARGEDGSLEHNLYQKQCAPLEVRDITHLYCNDKDCKVSGKYTCLLANLPCIESCACSSTVCPNSSTAQHSESDDEVSDNEDKTGKEPCTQQRQL